MISEFHLDPSGLGNIDLRPLKDLWHHVFSKFDASLNKRAEAMIDQRLLKLRSRRDSSSRKTQPLPDGVAVMATC
jgi:hypothetical protein